MKRIRPQAHEVVVPAKPVEVITLRWLFAGTRLADSDGEFTSGCLACPDEPCARFSVDELARPARVQSPYAPDISVCPTDAIVRGDDGLMAIDADRCIGCGLCAVRCPVGAICLDDSAGAYVEPPDPVHYRRVSMPDDEFARIRARLADPIEPEAAPFDDDPSLLSAQMTRALPATEGAQGQRVLRLVARNAFLLSGSAARLKNIGDNNAACELLLDGAERMLVVEVEPSADLPDAMRRAIAGCAIAISRLRAQHEHVAAGVVVPRLPNGRVEFYRVIEDVRARLGVETISIPLALLLLAIRAGGAELASHLVEFCRTDGTVDVRAITRAFGPIGDPIEIGLVPPK
jgi:ferredoxin